MPISLPKVAAGLPVFNVKDYGATGNGSTNDAAAIAAAATDAAAAGGGTVYFPAGVYITSTAVSLNNMRGVKLLGASSRRSDQTNPAATSVIKSTYAATAASPAFQVYGSGVEVRSLQFEFNNSSGAGFGYLLDLANCTDVTVSDCAFRNTSASARQGVGVNLSAVQRVTIERCHFFTFWRGVYGQNSARNVTVRECFFNFYTSGIDTTPQHWTVSGCHFYDDAGNIAINSGASASSLTIQGCRFDNFNTVVAGQVQVQGSGISISGNWWTLPSSAGGICLRILSYANGLAVTGNDFVNGVTAVSFDNAAYAIGALLSANRFNTTNRYANVNTTGVSILDDVRGPFEGTTPVFDAGTARWYPVNPDLSALTPQLTGNRSYAQPWLPGRAGTLTGVSIYVSTAATAGTVRFGLFTDNGGRPGNLLVDLGTVAVTTTATQVLTPTSYAFSSRLMWIVATPQGITGTLNTYGPKVYSPIVGDPTSPPTFGNGLASYYVDGTFTGAYGVVGTGFGAPAGVSTPPSIMLKIT